MLIRNDDLYDLMKLKDGDKIKITTGMKFSNNDILEVFNCGRLKLKGSHKDRWLSDLIDEEFEKVKEYKPISYEKAIRRMANGEETYILYKDKYLKCILTKSLNNSKEKAIIIKFDNYIIENIMDFIKALDYEFYVLM